MKRILNTLYITSNDKYLSLEGENIVVKQNGEKVARLPLHNIGSIITCGYNGVSPALLGACAKRNIDLVFLSYNGSFMARIVGEEYGNVYLRRTQYRIADNPVLSKDISKNFILGKIYNQRWIIERFIRDYPMRIDLEKFESVSYCLKNLLLRIKECNESSHLLGIEGEAASLYFSCFDDMILNQKESFYFNTRNRRPPLDNINAMISYGYTLLASECASALSSVGLDPYVGFFHTDRPGRYSLALDLMEELRSVMVDRLVLSIVNRKIIKPSDFFQKEDGAVLFTDRGKKIFLENWQKNKLVEIKHPYLKEKVQWGMVPYVQSLLLARFLRGDLDGYPVFLWK